MSAIESRTMVDVFTLLDEWRHLPAYRLEPNLAPFFGLFLRDVLTARFGVPMHRIVIPEFPLRKGTLSGDGSNGSNQSQKVDYLAFSEDLTTAYFVELKTDMGSVREEQNEYLEKARHVPLRELVAGVICICKATDTKWKYCHLLFLLSELGLVTPPKPKEEDKTKVGDPSFDWRSAFKGVTPTEAGSKTKVKVVFIQPRDDNFEHIDFPAVADTVQKTGDLGCMFANYLRQWTEEAGLRNPRESLPRK